MKKYKTVYVITCTQGCYSDQMFWVECCFTDKEKALRFKELKDLKEKERRENEDVSLDEREYYVTETIIISGSIDLEAININNIFDYLGFPGNEDIYIEEEDQ